jgi:phasin family protein
MSSITEQFSAVTKSQLEAQFQIFNTLAQTAVDSAEKLIALNFSASKASVEKSSAAAKKLLEVKDAKELFSVTRDAPTGLDSLLAYSRELFAIASGAQAELIKNTRTPLLPVLQQAEKIKQDIAQPAADAFIPAVPAVEQAASTVAAAAVAEPAVAAPASTEPAATEPASTEPAETEPVKAESVKAEPAAEPAPVATTTAPVEAAPAAPAAAAAPVSAPVSAPAAAAASAAAAPVGAPVAAPVTDPAPLATNIHDAVASAVQSSAPSADAEGNAPLAATVAPTPSADIKPGIKPSFPSANTIALAADSKAPKLKSVPPKGKQAEQQGKQKK